MPGIQRLIERPDAIEPGRGCGAALDWFLDNPQFDLLAVVEGGRAIGVLDRGAVAARHADRCVVDFMAPALYVGADAEIDEACAILLAHSAPSSGLVVVEAGVYVGVLPARALLGAKCETAPRPEPSAGFAGLISREMRSPLNGVLAVAELLRRQPLPADAQSFVRTIIESCNDMITALDDALELSRAEDGMLAFARQPVLLRELMDQLQARWHDRASQDGVSFTVAYHGEPELTVEIDTGRLDQVFDGLIGGVLLASRQGSIEVSLAARRQAVGLRLTGRVRGASAGQDLGVNFALCRRIVEQLGGEMRIEANVGAGSTIQFDLPVGEVVGADQLASTAVAKRAAHVLVVDDNATNRMVAEALCEMFDCTSESVEDGIEAVDAARTGRFDLILMDIRMPRMDGVEATLAIRALPGPAGAAPIIALTANADPEDVKVYLASGMQSVVEKPIKPERLLQAINACLPDAAASRAAA